ncbi:MAG: xylulokinase [Arachnia sp.]
MPASPLVIAVDSSTTATKALILNDEGEVHAAGRADIRLHTPQLSRYEHDPLDWWRSTDVAIGQAIAALAAPDRSRVSALCITPQRQSFALVADDGSAIRPGILWLDGRAVAEVAELGSGQVHALSGFQPDVTPSLYKIAWLARHEPEALRRADKVVGVHGYLCHALTGSWVDSAACADSLGLFDMAQLTWSPELLDMAGLRPDQLPDLVAPGAVVGEVTSDHRARWGLPGPVTVVAGCGDGQAAGLGCGAVHPDEAYLNLGTAIVAGVHSRQYRHGDSYRTDAAGLPGQFVLEIVQNSGAYLAGWFRSELGDPALDGRPDPALESAAAKVAPGVGGLVTLPYWNAAQSPHWNPVARGAIVGLAGQHGRPELYRSLLEGLCLETARNLGALQADTGVPLTSVRVMGGGQRSALWRRIMTDAVGLPLTACATEEVSALGAGMLAVAHHSGASIKETSTRMARPSDVTAPDPGTTAVYAELGAIQGGLYQRLRETFEQQYRFAATHPLGGHALN